MKKNFKSRIIAALVAVTALTCCFVGSTFAKYTSTSQATATATVAKWDITGITDATSNSFTFTADKLSPALTGATNTLTSETLTITNNSDVAAYISFEKGDVTVNYKESKADWDNSWGDQANIAEAVFTANVSSTATATDGKYLVAANGGTLTLTVSLTWNTQADNGDAIDTYFGMNATTLALEVNLTAVQASQLPTA